ncbi:MAG: hypothetical protein ACKOWO_04665 [Sediminibacterium sp.]
MTKWIVLKVVLLTSLIEYYFINELYYCVSWAIQSLFFMIAALIVLIALIMISFKYVKSAFLISCLGGMFIVSFCSYKLTILNYLKNESDKLIRFASNEKIASGKYPSKLKYKIDNRIIYTKIDDNNFNIFYYVTDDNSGHFFNPKEGWGYMDD